MKRANHFFANVCAMDNLRRAYLLARRGKRERKDVVEFSRELPENLLQIRRALLDGSIAFGPYREFVVHEPKERIIRVAPFPDRVVHQALMRICEPVFEDFQIYDSYACRKGKGTYAALDRAKAYSLHYEWYLKLDMRKYFDSIPHQTLAGLLQRRFKEKHILEVFGKIIGSHQSNDHGDEPRGLPIGNLTSQFFANHVLAVADRYGKEQLHIPAYVRYMDDIVLWGTDRDQLVYQALQLARFCESLGLSVKPWCMNRSAEGMPFLGYVVHEGKLYLTRRAEKRFCAKLQSANQLLNSGIWNQAAFAGHVEPLLAFRSHAVGRWTPQEHFNLKSSMGFEPRESRRQLEQQRAELPVGEPQQQQPVEPQQQHWFATPLRTPSSEVGTDVSTEPDDFVASLWRRIVNGVSSLFGRWANPPFTPFFPLYLKLQITSPN